MFKIWMLFIDINHELFSGNSENVEIDSSHTVAEYKRKLMCKSITIFYIFLNVMKYNKTTQDNMILLFSLFYLHKNMFITIFTYYLL